MPAGTPGGVLRQPLDNRLRIRSTTKLFLCKQLILWRPGRSINPAPKNARNVATRGISFNLAAAFEWDNVLIVEDTRKDYGERRFQALGLIAARLHVLVFTRREAKVHVISLRKANKREVKQYEAQA
jgi:uncharacterized DUF497 family protein